MAAQAATAWPRNLERAGVPPEIAAQVEDSGRSLVPQGVAAVPDGVTPAVGELVTDAAHASFTAGMHAALWVGALTLVACAVLGLLTHRRASPAPDDASQH